MRGGFIISRQLDVFDTVAEALSELGGSVRSITSSERYLDVVDESGHRFMLWETIPAGTEWELHEGPFTAAPGVELPDMRTVAGCPFECRWPELVATLGSLIAAGSEQPLWVLDGDGVVWDAAEIDAKALTL